MRCADVHVPVDERRRFFVSARTKEDAIVMLDEWENAEGAEITQISCFMVDFRLNDEGDLELAEFGESCRDAILEKAYPRLIEAMTISPVTASGRSTAERKAIVPIAVQEERTRPLTLKATRLPQPATEADRTLQKKMGASAGYANRAVEEMATNILEMAPENGPKQ